MVSQDREEIHGRDRQTDAQAEEGPDPECRRRKRRSTRGAAPAAQSDSGRRAEFESRAEADKEPSANARQR